MNPIQKIIEHNHSLRSAVDTLEAQFQSFPTWFPPVEAGKTQQRGCIRVRPFGDNSGRYYLDTSSNFSVTSDELDGFMAWLGETFGYVVTKKDEGGDGK